MIVRKFVRLISSRFFLLLVLFSVALPASAEYYVAYDGYWDSCCCCAEPVYHRARKHTYVEPESPSMTMAEYEWIPDPWDP